MSKIIARYLMGRRVLESVRIEGEQSYWQAVADSSFGTSQWMGGCIEQANTKADMSGMVRTQR
jgi:hypothetical protein